MPYSREHIPWNKGIKTGDKISAKGKKLLSELRKIPVKRICVVCDKEFLAGNSAKYCNNKCRPRRLWRAGERPKRGTKYPEWREARQKAIERDGAKCYLCEKYIGKSISVHHIDEKGYCNSAEPNNNLDNLICMCNKCHLFITCCLFYRKNRDWKKVENLIYN